MSVLPRIPAITYAEYLAAEELSDVRHEFYQGNVLAMAGGTGAHARLKTNLTGAVHAALRGRPCHASDTDQRIRITATDLSTYPDLSVVCGPRIPDEIDRHAMTNPTVLCEVLSKATAGYDRGEKFDNYAHIATLQQYVLVDSERVHVDVYTRLDDGTWARRGHGPGDAVRLASIGVDLILNDLYEGWAEECAIDAGATARA